MEQQGDREQRIGAALLLGLAAFVLIALASFYFRQTELRLTRDHENMAATTR